MFSDFAFELGNSILIKPRPGFPSIQSKRLQIKCFQLPKMKSRGFGKGAEPPSLVAGGEEI